MNVFNDQETNEKFERWLTISNGISYNPQDMDRFYSFALEYYRKNEFISKDAFVRATKVYTHTSRTENYGICQKFYYKLETLVDYLRWSKKEKE